MENKISQILKFDSLDSTNIRALQLAQLGDLQERQIVFTDFQTNGKGQNGNSWQSETSKNLTFSFLKRHSVSIENQFFLIKAVALGLKKYIDNLSVGMVKIKWPNDILVNGKKIAGILIENSITGQKINFSIIGIGFNVNQTKFPKYDREAISLAILRGRPMNRERILEDLFQEINLQLDRLEDDAVNVSKEYIASLYGLGKSMEFQDEGGNFEGVILSVLPNGKLQINKMAKLKTYDLKEIKFIT